ncbi:hypothetical protein XACG117_3200007 [Xanthomonas citri pv. citri]|nr:hypothetical protein XACG102_10680007 [Xanthomonas citri pv. citri]CEI03106.1 hypothetical protein XACG117_3200007 [Xanthomonas citri pv. citri]
MRNETMSQILICHDFSKLRENVKLPVYWREAQVSNHHVGRRQDALDSPVRHGHARRRGDRHLRLPRRH